MKYLKKLIKDIVCKIYYKYYFIDEKQANLFITYYIPGVYKNGPDGTYFFGQLNEKIDQKRKEHDFVKPIYSIQKLEGELKIDENCN